MIRLLVLGLLAAGAALGAQAATLVISEGDGQVTEQYFEKGEFVQMRDDRPSMGVDREGNCWFVEHRRVVSDPCEEMLQSVDAMREQVMASLSEEDRAMMQRAAEMQRTAAPAVVTSLGERKIAGYSVLCHRIGAKREVCTSEKLLQKIRAEMGDSRFLELFQRFGRSAGEMGGETPESKAVIELASRGFPMLDMQSVVATPGLDPAVLQYLPEAQRTQIMSRLGSATGGEKMRGTQVIRVVTDVKMPDFDLSRYPRVDFERYLHQTMGEAGRR
jgi:hypothetical protein